jgi:DNA-binding transcriptional regulator YhcF (GntR family)
MNDWTKKRKESYKDFEERKERAIQQIKDKVFVATKSKKFQFTEKQLREEFAFDDMQKMYGKFDNFFTDATFILYPEDQIIEV